MKLRDGKVRIKIVVGMGTSGIAMGAREVMKTSWKKSLTVI
jgi:cysteine synthase